MSVQLGTSEGSQKRHQPSSPTTTTRVRIRSDSSNASVATTSRAASALLGELGDPAGEFTCVPGVRVFNSDGSVRASYRSEIGSAYIMLPDGTYQRYEEFCQKCSSPLLGGDRLKVNVILDQHKASYPIQFKNQLIYPHLQYKTCLKNQWVTVLGSSLHASGNPAYLILNDTNYPTPFRIYEVFPVSMGASPSYPFYYRGLYIDRERRYKIFVNNRYVVVFGSQLSPGSEPNTLYLNQGPNNFVLVTEIYSYDSAPAPVQPTPAQPSYSFLYRGLPIYTYGYYKIFINTRWLTVLGSQLAPTPDGSAVIYYQNPNTPHRVEQIVAVTPNQPIRPLSPQDNSNYNPYHKTPSSTPSHKPPRKSPSPSRAPPGSPGSPTGYYGQQNSIHFNYNQQSSSQQTTVSNTWNTTTSNKQPSPKQPPPKQPSPTQQPVPANMVYPFKFQGVNIHEDRLYQVRINTSWEIVSGSQIRPIPGDESSLIVNIDKDRAGIVTEVYLYHPERYTPVNLSIRNIRIKPSLTYYVDLGPVAGCLIVRGNKIQRHPNRSSGMVWFKGTYHEIIDCRLIMNGNTEESESVVIDAEKEEEEEEEAGKTCQCGAPCSILPFQCPNCMPNGATLLALSQKPSPVPQQQQQEVQPVQQPEPVKSPPGILRSPSRSSILRTSSEQQQHHVTKSVKIVTSSPEAYSSSSSSSSSSSDEEKRRPTFKNIPIEPDSLYSVLLENNTTKIVSGRLIKARSSRKYVKVRLDNEVYKSYFIRPVTPEGEDEVTPVTSTSFYRIYLNSRWRVIPTNNVRPSKRKPGRFVVVYNSTKYYVKAVNVVPVILPDGCKYPTGEEEEEEQRPSLVHACTSPVHPHPISPEQHARQLSPSPDTTTLQYTLPDLSISSQDYTAPAEEPGRTILPLSALYDQFGQLKPEYASLLGSGEPSVVMPDRPDASPYVILPKDTGWPDPSPPQSGGAYPPKIIPPQSYAPPDWAPSSPQVTKPAWREPSSPGPTTKPTWTSPSSPGPTTKPAWTSPSRPASTAIPVVVNGTLVHTDSQYTLTINSTTHTVYGRHFKQRKEYPGQYTVKVGDCRYLVPVDTTVLPVPPNKSVTFGPVSTADQGGTTAAATPGHEDSDSDTPDSERGFIVLIRGSWVRVGPKAVRPSKTQAGYSVVKFRDTVHLVLQRDVRPLRRGEELVTLECTLPTGRRLIRTWFVEKLPSRNCLEAVLSLARTAGEEPVFVIRNSTTRNINDIDIRKFTSCIRVHFENSQIIFEDDYLQLAETGFGAACPIWVVIRRNRNPRYYKMVNDMTTAGGGMDVSVSDSSYSSPATGGYTNPVAAPTSSPRYKPPSRAGFGAGFTAATSRASSSAATSRVSSSSRATYRSSANTSRKSTLFNKLERGVTSSMN